MIPLGDENRPGRLTPVVTYLLIALNVLAFLVELGQPDVEGFLRTWGTVPARIRAGQGYETLITAMFLHGGWAHLLGNMLFLWVFGDNVEDAFGHGLYALYYFACGIAASLAHVFTTTDPSLPGVGASGAISGVLAAYVLMFASNRVRVLLFRFITVVPAWVMIGLWAVFQFVNGYAAIADTAQTGGIAYGAHIGGFVAGLVLTLLLRPLARRDQPRPI